tara:strand:+ start:8958 stop:9800 length:843 start_codon:yes stop_codon:yes gene_type:complete
VPVYNDWKSLNKLLYQLNEVFRNYKKFKNEILIVNDDSSEKINIKKNNLLFIKKITVITLKKNLGSQKAIAIGLFYLKKKEKDSFVTIMDSDGEDDPFQINTMLKEAKKNKSFVITSNRKKRKESITIQVLYKIHLIITFIFTFKWISFGNFTTFNSKNITKILSNNDAWYAYSSSVIRNCKIKRLYAKREKRYFDKSKLNLLTLMEHSLRVNSVFLPKVFLNSLFYLIVILFIPYFIYLSNIFIFLIIIFNILLIFIRKKHHIKNLIKIDNHIENVKLL